MPKTLLLALALLPLLANARPNVLVITVDDLNADSLGCFGCPLEGTSPNIDELASQSLVFAHAHVNIAVCQPCRGVVMTGRYSHLSGIEGFQHLPPDSDTPTLMESMRDAGYRTAILGKVGHFTPKPDFPWDLAKDQPDLGHGRDPKLYAKYTAQHIAAAKSSDQPFFLVANAHDPHRPFHGNDPEKYRTSKLPAPPPSHTYQPSEVPVPKFLPDIPEVRQEVSEYFSSVRRADDVVGAVLAELENSGQADNTLVIFFSDHGMALPFAKTNCYYHSTHTPLIVRYPGKTKPGTTDDSHVLSTVDFYPTILEACHIPAPPKLDGRSFLPVLSGATQDDRDYAFTQFHQTSGRNRFPMRAVVSRDHLYVYNPWSDGKLAFRNESQAGRTWRAMVAASSDNTDVATRVELFSHRVPEEFFDLKTDPDALHNNLAHPQLETYRKRLATWMEKTNDPALTPFQNRTSETARTKFMADQQAKANKKRRK